MRQQLHGHAGHRCVISSCAVSLHLLRCCPNRIASGTTKFVWCCCAGRGALQPAIRGKPSDGGGHPSAAICRAVSLSRLWLVLGRVSSSLRHPNMLWKLSASRVRCSVRLRLARSARVSSLDVLLAVSPRSRAHEVHIPVRVCGVFCGASECTAALVGWKGTLFDTHFTHCSLSQSLLVAALYHWSDLEPPWVPPHTSKTAHRPKL